MDTETPRQQKTQNTSEPVAAPTKMVMPDELRDVSEFFGTYRTQLILALLVSVMVVAGTYVYFSKKQKAVEAASLIYQSAQTPQELEALVQKYPSSPEAPLSLLRIAKGNLEAGSVDVALGKYEEFKRLFPQHEFVDAAELGRMHCLEAAGKVEDALAAYEIFAKSYPNHYVKAEVVIGRARCLEVLNRFSEAKAVYEDYIVAYPESGWTPRIKELLEDLTAKMAKSSPVVTPVVQATTTADVNVKPTEETIESK